MNKIKVFNKSDLSSLIEEATIDTLPDEWVASFLSGVAGMIAQKPITYRSFGVFWWPLKKYLQDANFIGGETVDVDLFNQITMGDIVTDLAAAYACHDTSIKSQTSLNTTHTVLDMSGESIDFQVIDNELE